MKKKDYNVFVSYQNIPHLQKLTWLLGAAYATLSLNTILTFFHCRKFTLLIMFIWSVILIPIKMSDPLRENRGLHMVVGSWIVAIGYTVLIASAYSFFSVDIVLAAEVFILLVYLYLSHSLAKRRLKKW